MKKFLSITLAVMMIFSVASIASISAMAAVKSPETTTAINIKGGQVNGSSSNDVTYKVNPDDTSEITFTYNGNGSLSDWEFPGMVEGVDYEIVSIDGDSITIRLLNDYSGDVIANAIVDEEVTDATVTTKKPSGGSTSPSTGVTAATGIALAGAGVAVLAVLKKKNGAE